MTSPTGDGVDELRFICTDGFEHQIGKRYDERRGVGNGPQICLRCQRILAELIEAYAASVAREARIDELEKWRNAVSNSPNYIERKDTLEWMDKRLVELTPSNDDRGGDKDGKDTY